MNRKIRDHSARDHLILDEPARELPAVLLGTLRRLSRDPTLPPLPKIRSLAYFLPVIEELKLQPLPDGYLHYLRLKLRRLSA